MVQQIAFLQSEQNEWWVWVGSKSDLNTSDGMSIEMKHKCESLKVRK
jgi:hypothetical protein